jgi:fatty acid desaturase
MATSNEYTVGQGQHFERGDTVLSASESVQWLTGEGESLPSSQREFAELCRRVRASGLLQKKPAYLWFRPAVLLPAIALVALAVILQPHNLAVQVLNGILLGFIFMQTGFLLHDVGHRQMARQSPVNRVAGMFFGNLLTGVSYSWWVEKHNRHHRNPNHVDHDPDVQFAGLAFSRDQALAKSRPLRWVVRHQAFLFLPFLLAEHWNLQALSAEHVLRGRAKYGWAEGILLGCHHVACFWIAFSAFGLLPGLAFLLWGKGLAGFYAGMVFAPNHKGMLVVDSSSQIDLFRQQVLTSRNIRSSHVHDFLYGGLNYQIEHHLFPFLRQDQLARAQAIVRPFCLERGVRYHETGILQSLREIFGHLHQVGESLRVDSLAKTST